MKSRLRHGDGLPNLPGDTDRQHLLVEKWRWRIVFDADGHLALLACLFLWDRARDHPRRRIDFHPVGRVNERKTQAIPRRIRIACRDDKDRSPTHGHGPRWNRCQLGPLLEVFHLHAERRFVGKVFRIRGHHTDEVRAWRFRCPREDAGLFIDRHAWGLVGPEAVANYAAGRAAVPDPHCDSQPLPLINLHRSQRRELRRSLDLYDGHGRRDHLDRKSRGSFLSIVGQ